MTFSYQNLNFSALTRDILGKFKLPTNTAE